MWCKEMKVQGIALLFVCAFITFCNSAYAQNNHLIIAGDEEKEGTYLVAITEHAFKRVGYTTEFIFVPWKRALENSIAGKYDVLLAAYYTDERAKTLNYSNPIGSAKVMLLKLANRAISYHSLEDLKPYRIGHIRGSSVSKTFDVAEKNYLTIEYAHNAETNLRKLLANRLDLVIEKKQRIDDLLSTEFSADADRVEFLYPPLNQNYFYNCVSKLRPNHGKVMADFNRGLEEIKNDGTMKNILRQHGISPEQEPPLKL